MIHVKQVLHQTDWALLAQQKEALVDEVAALHVSRRRLIEEGEKSAADLALEHCNALDGLVHFLDALQDAAELDEFPVVFLTEGDDPDEPVTSYAQARGLLLHLTPQQADQVFDYSVAGAIKYGHTLTAVILKDNADHLAEEENWFPQEENDNA